ncbi:MAG: UvrD-helicase domain-containing protein [FCB group bacterium]|nr:UvrD-helicase domain-containing protein [FCB group bacterium]
MNIKDKLNPQQLEAVINTDGPILVLAGAGSGKTRVLTHKIAYLLSECNVKPWEILAVTFTNKAAGVMKDRIQEIVSEDIQAMRVGTFHSVFAGILRRHCDKIGYKSTFAIYDREDQIKVMKEILANLPSQGEGITPKRAIGIVSSMKSSLKSPAENSYSLFSGPNRQELYDAYQKKLKSYGAFDFDDLLLKPLELFRQHDEIAGIYRERFRYILVDEFQDTNAVQNELLKILWKKHKNITVVGDDDQSIYGWRGAEITNILHFDHNFPNAKIFRLERNYRSSKQILEVAQAVIDNNFSRHGKTLWTDKDSSKRPTLFSCSDARDEAHTIAGVVEELTAEGLKRTDIGILYRTNAQSRILEEAFRECSIPYTIVGGLKFYQRKEIKDLLAYIKLIVNSDDAVSLFRIINFPPRGIGQKTLSNLTEFAKTEGHDVWNALLKIEQAVYLKPAVIRKLKNFAKVMVALSEDFKTLTFPEFVKKVLERSGMIDQYLKEGDEEAFARIDNLDEFVAGVEDWSQRYPDRTIEDFLQEAALVSDVDEWEEGDYVSMMTIHSAKGLEFSAVAVTGLEEGLFPLIREGDSDIEEERRLFYVGTTRAKDRLFLSHASSRRENFGVMASRFVEEIPDELLEHQGKQIRTYEPPRERTYSAKGSSTISDPAAKVKPSPGFKRGDNVEHSKFGEGTVAISEVRGDDEIVTVFFRGYGAKKLVARIAGLRKIGGGY